MACNFSLAGTEMEIRIELPGTGREIVMKHLQTYAGLREDGRPIFRGPFVDNDSGRMMIAVEAVTGKILRSLQLLIQL